MEELSAVLLLQQMLDSALEQRCSDIHIFTLDEELVVQFRVSGWLQPWRRISGHSGEVIRRIKALARMDVADTRVPQDGAFHWISEAMECDVRVSTLPTIHGEAVVMRLFPKLRAVLDFVVLGMSQNQARIVGNWLGASSGLVIVAGPTNSGKTTTLYAMMMQLARCGRKVVSIEDPVERPMADCQQVEVREQVGVTWEVGLRALLRHDPDAIMIGEIRDERTAAAALRASLTGHLVLTTVHAPDAVGALVRLCELGMTRHTLGEAVRGIVAQHFVDAVHTGSTSDTHRPPVFDLLPVHESLVASLASDDPWWKVRIAALRRNVPTGLSS